MMCYAEVWPITLFVYDVLSVVISGDMSSITCSIWPRSGLVLVVIALNLRIKTLIKSIVSDEED